MNTPVDGDNQDPSPIDDLKNRLTDATAEIEGRIRMIRVALERIPETVTEDIESQVTDQVGQAKLALRQLEEMRVQQKRPYDDLVSTVQGHFKPISELLSEPKGAKGGIMERVLLRLGAYQKAKADRERAERAAAQRKAEIEAERLRQKAAAEEARAGELARSAQTNADREAAADAAQRAQEAKTASVSAEKVAVAAARPTPAGHAIGTGARSHLRTVWKITVVDLKKVPRDYLMLDESKVNQAISAGFTKIEGLQIDEEAAATVVVAR